jgi:hypothetical protein
VEDEMSAPKHKKTDRNQTDIVDGLRKCGVSVTITSDVGDGFVDAVAGYRGVNYLLEIKDGEQPPSKRKLTPAEAEWHEAWKGTAHVVKSLDEALAVVGVTGPGPASSGEWHWGRVDMGIGD